MPSLLHEMVIALFRNHPELAAQLLSETLQVGLPHWSTVTVSSSDLGEVRPADYRADLVLILGDPTPVFGIVVEVQLAKVRQKPKTWLHYAVALGIRHRCPTCVLVVSPDESVARWAAKPRNFGPGIDFQALVVGPDVVPVVTEASVASASPQLAVLSAIAHGRGDPEVATKIAITALGAAVGLDEEEMGLYVDYIRAALGREALLAFEAHMDMERWEPLTDWGRERKASWRKARDEAAAEGRAVGEAEGRALGEAEGRALGEAEGRALGEAEGRALGEAEGRALGEAEGRALGEAEGRALGEAEGRALGEAEGRAAGEARSIVTILDARGVVVPPTERERILACRDLETLDRWLRRSVVLTQVAELFED
jgi:hypothetical protein